MQDEGTKKRKKPAGAYRWHWDDELQRSVHTFTRDPAPPLKRKTFQLPRSAFSPLFPQIFNNSRLLHDLFFAPGFLLAPGSICSGSDGDLAALARTCKAFAPLRHKGTAEVYLGYFLISTLKYPARFIAGLASPGSASVLTTLHVVDHALYSAELWYELGDVFTQGLPVLRELQLGKAHEVGLWVSWEG